MSLRSIIIRLSLVAESMMKGLGSLRSWRRRGKAAAPKPWHRHLCLEVLGGLQTGSRFTAPKPPRTLLRVEHLEVRLAPAQFTWVATANVAGGAIWNNQNCWVDQNNAPGVPGAGDDVIFDGNQSNVAVNENVAFNAANPLSSITFQNKTTVNMTLNQPMFVVAVNMKTGTSGTITGPNNLTVVSQGNTAGSFIFQAGSSGISGATVNLSLGTTMTIGATLNLADGAQIINNGAINWDGGDIALAQGSVVDTAAGGTFTANNANAPSQILVTPMLGNNFERLVVEAGGTYTEKGSHTITVRVDGDGTFNINGQTTFANGSKLSNTAVINIAAGDALSLVGAAEHVWSSATETGAGTLQMMDNAATLDVAGTVDVDTFNQSGGSLDGSGVLQVHVDYTFSGGTWDGDGSVLVLGGATLEMAPPAGTVNRTLTNDGTTTFGASIKLGAGMDIVNNGQMTIPGITIYDGNGPPAAQLVNQGAITFDAANGTAVIATPFEQKGVVYLTSGSTIWAEDVEQSAGAATHLNGGSLDVQGTFTIDQFSTLDGTGAIQVGTLVNNGEISVGWAADPTGQLSIQADRGLANTGNYTQGGTGILDMTLFGATPNKSCNTLAISGTAQLAGTVNILTGGNYVPATGDEFQLITWGAQIGTFDSVTASWTAVYMGGFSVTYAGGAGGAGGVGIGAPPPPG